PAGIAASGGLGQRDLRGAGRLLPRPAGTVPQCVQAPVGGDPVQPGTQRGTALEPGQAAPGGQQGFLQQILGVLDRAEDAVAVHLKLAPVGLDQLAERLPVARAGLVQQLLAGHGTSFVVRSHTGIDTSRGQNWSRPVSGRPGVTSSDGERKGTTVPGTARAVSPGRPGPMTAAQRWVIGLASVGSFMVVLDLLVVATALTSIHRGLHASIED